MAKQYLAENESKEFSPSGKFPPSVWGCSFASFSFQEPEFESYNKEVEALKEKVRDLFVQSTDDVIENIEFINLLCRLGVSYHFESEIYGRLDNIFISIPSILEDNDFDLSTLALLFHVLRLHGYKLSCDVFNKFKDSNGEFKTSITNDAKGLLCLYEATFMSVRGEDILDEALVFTRQQLETALAAANQIISPHLANHIRNALFLPFCRNVERIATRQYIAFYEEEEHRNETLLKFAKLDFNRLQSLYRQELALLSNWWKDLNLTHSFPDARDRIVECFFWALGMHFEPPFGLSRTLTAKCTALEVMMDDLYDSSGKMDELEQFTAAMLRGTNDAVDQLTEPMKCLYSAILNFFKETENIGNEGRISRNFYVKKEIKELIGNLLLEQKWYNDGHIPVFDEYVRASMVTISLGLYPASSFIGMENMVTIEEYEWLQNNTNLHTDIKLLCRLKDDIEDDDEKEVRASCIKCYMKDYDVSQNEAIEEIRKMSENTMKDIIEESMRPITLSRSSRVLLKYYFNCARTIFFLFRHGDSFTSPQKMKDKIAPLFLEPFQL